MSPGFRSDRIPTPAAPAAVVVGASSGIGRELALLLAQRGRRLGLAARRLPLLHELAATLASPPPQLRFLDAAQPVQAAAILRELLAALAPVDLVVIAAGTGDVNPDLRWEIEQETLMVNVLGFTALADTALQHFLAQGHGHLVGITSLAARRGHGDAASYGASKSFQSAYLRNLRHLVRRRRLPIAVTDAQPGLTATRMARGDNLFWVMPPAQVAAQILAAIDARRERVTVTRRWALLGLLLDWLPDVLYDRL